MQLFFFPPFLSPMNSLGAQESSSTSVTDVWLFTPTAVWIDPLVEIECL
jgi:hypothetical protein